MYPFNVRITLTKYKKEKRKKKTFAFDRSSEQSGWTCTELMIKISAGLGSSRDQEKRAQFLADQVNNQDGLALS